VGRRDKSKDRPRLIERGKSGGKLACDILRYNKLLF
jgi:hypothetical protein